MKTDEQNPLKYITALSAIFLIGAVLFFSVYLFFQNRFDEMDSELDNNCSRISIGKEIVRNIDLIERNFYKLFTTTNQAGQKALIKETQLFINTIYKALYVLQDGGVLSIVHRMNLEEKSELIVNITYKPTHQKEYLSELLQLKPVLDETEKRMKNLALLLTEHRQLYKDNRPLRDLREFKKRIDYFLILSPAHFVRMRENANQIFYKGQQDIERLKSNIDNRKSIYIYVEIALMLIIVIGLFLTIWLILRQSLMTVKRLENSRKEISRLATVIEQAVQIVIITDLKGNIEYVNPAFEKITGYSATEAIGRNPRILKSGEQDGGFYKNLWDTITSGKTWQGIFANKKKDGTIFYDRAVIFPIKNKQNEIVNFAAVKQDVTKERELEQQLQQAHKMESIGTLAGGVAHDFNNILTIINGYSEIALLNMDESNPLYSKMTAIQEAGHRAENLTRQLLAFSRKQIYKTEVVEINDVIQDMEKMLRRLISEDIRIKMILPKNLPKIKADKSQLEQVFMNLLLNARDAVNAKSKENYKKEIIIETGFSELDEDYAAQHPGISAGSYICFSVSDNGIGMDETIRRQVFEPFFTTKEKYKGTGLGMSTVYGIVKQNSGCIFVYSELNEGTRVKIYWPVTKEKKVSDQTEESAAEMSGKETILLVEDDLAVCEFASAALSSFGYTVIKAKNGQAALEKIESENLKFDLIITDIIMPELNGKEFVEKAREIYPSLKVVFVSGYTYNHIVNNGLLEEGVNFVQKPYSLKALATVVRKALA